eukprot:TRINITY_DN3054_c0_g1_i5.p1 TRINITY_DN3054_c0_g1~~TRINITY_DN3054_c0_g1_i5.p1  ORF type:complete len:283 (-),score=41.99 TRINITY_DN3054_c0_g1_i5:215-1063(-)
MNSEGVAQVRTNEQSEVSRSLSESSDFLNEQQWHKTGVNLAMSTINEKIIEQKERELQEAIMRNYSKIKDAESELTNLQLQLKLTAGPKKSALELIRKKIEQQNEKVVAAREKMFTAKKVYEAAEADLKAEESVKEELCQELNLLVHQSAKLQLDKLEQLTQRIENLNSSITRNPSLTSSDPPVSSSHGVVEHDQPMERITQQVVAAQQKTQSQLATSKEDAKGAEVDHIVKPKTRVGNIQRPRNEKRFVSGGGLQKQVGLGSRELVQNQQRQQKEEFQGFD